MNDLIKVGTSMNCDAVDFNMAYPDAKLRHNLLGCHVIQLIKFMYNLNITYVTLDPKKTDDEYLGSILENGTIDMYARPVSLSLEKLEYSYPIQSIFMWRVGFILSRQHHQHMTKFYRKPFNRTVWFCLIGMTLLTTVIFFILSSWESYLGSNGECSFLFELLLAIGGFCQHIVPIETTTTSRRAAYFFFFLFSYIVYTYYTSNLLSYLVSDREDDWDLEDLDQNGYNYVFLEDIKEYHDRVTDFLCRANISSIFTKGPDIPIVNLTTALEAVKTNRTALLTDYVTVNRNLSKSLTNKEMCDLIEIDLFSQLRKYLITSKDFRYKEQIKISTLRMQEAGIIKHLTTDPATPPDCSVAVEVTTSIQQVSGLLMVLIGCYIFTGFLLLCEIVHFRRYRVWPYTE